MSGRGVAEALVRCGHKVTASDIGPGDTSALRREGIEVVFIALHGEFGEDGSVQRLCEEANLRYVGSGPEASALAMDKPASKLRFRRAGLATPDWVVVDRGCLAAERRALLSAVPPPCVVKPTGGGSSVDVVIARGEAARDAALDDLLEKYGRAMVEAFVAGREMTVGILGERPLPIVEIRPAREFYDYVAKYHDDATEYVVHPPLPTAAAQHLQAAGLTAHRALGCRDFSRVDFILGPDGLAHVLEVNTIPGFTSHSLLPKAAAAAGIGFDHLCDAIVRLAMER
jgi:D-alanine-D-alanine ligase